ncbi:MAG: gliding motility-associated C-terminal domain-containing protein [Bacteroidota bacterium]|nr:gliding motility-associated C-terminal domain-containing protein [Bacteroidota bacterium]
MKKLLSLFFVLFLINTITYATHIVGGEITLKSLGGQNFKLTLNLYFDNNSGDPRALDNQVRVGLFSKKDNALLDTFKLPIQFINDIPNEASVCKFITLKTRQIQYQLEVKLTKEAYKYPEGFYAAYERCCRNGAIVNIRDPFEAAAAFYSEFPSINTINSSPAFKQIDKNGFSCVNKPFIFDFSATDDNGDSLVYELAIPLNGHKDQGNPGGWPGAAPYQLVNFTNGISLQNMIYGNPSLDINANTGILSVTGTIPGVYVFGVDCKEYRKGIYLGKVHREYQLMVVRCTGENNPPKVNAFNVVKGGYYQKKDTIKIDNRYKGCIPIYGSDTTVGQKLTISAQYMDIKAINPVITVNPYLKVTLSPTDTLKTEICVDPCKYLGAPAATLRLILKNENNCTEPKYDSLYVVFKDNAPKHKQPIITSTLPNNQSTIYVDDVITFSVSGISQDSNFIALWYDKNNYFDVITLVGKGNISNSFTFTGLCDNVRNGPVLFTFLAFDSVCAQKLYTNVPLQINVLDSLDSYAPRPNNVITPNGDMVNDVFKLSHIPRVSKCSESVFSVQIFNRWGAQMYVSNDTDFEWNPTSTSEGIYYYQITYGTKRKTYKGWIQVLR